MKMSDIIKNRPDGQMLRVFGGSSTTSIAMAMLIVALGSCLGGLIWYAQKPASALPQFQDRFEELRSIESRWDAGILALQLGIAPNYDAVSATARDLQLGLADLEEATTVQPELAELVEGLKTYRASIGKKDLLFQQVKASYAMLRNAVSVLPSAIAECYVHPGVLSFVGTSNKRISDLITESINGGMSFLISPTPLLRTEVEERLARTRTAAQTADLGLASSLNRLLAQIDVVVRERYKGNDLSLQLNAVDTDETAGRIMTQIRTMDTRAADMKRDLWTAIIILGAVLAFSFLALLYLLSRRFLKLSKDNVMLQQANENVEEQLVQSAKLSALGQMVAGITHEINTPLAYVRAVFELIRERMMTNPVSMGTDVGSTAEENQEELVMLLDDGLHGLDEIATLIRTMKNFSRLDKGTIESFLVEEGIESALLLAKPQLKYVADVKKEFDSVPAIMASPTQLRQVLLNLIVNAADAMATMNRRGTLTLRTRITSSDTVQIDVCDDGPGISEENLAKIFDPFFTTKAVGHGTGMGLSICYRIIENHGGTIAINSKVGKGTVITVTLPRQDATFSASAKTTGQPGPSGETPKLLSPA